MAQPCDAAEGALGRIVVETDAAVVKGAQERWPWAEHVVERLGELRSARKPDEQTRFDLTEHFPLD